MKLTAMNNDKFLKLLEEAPLVPVFYTSDTSLARSVMKACYDGGVRAFEFADRGQRALEVFSSLAPFSSAMPGLVLGAGSVSSVSHALKFIRRGARFIVGPQFVPGIARLCRIFGVPYIPGCGTASEVGRAQRAGCPVCKIFPGEVLGPAFVKAILAPMPWSRIMVSGGVRPEKDSLEAWFSAGVTCVGMGSSLVTRADVASGNMDAVETRCREILQTVSGFEF